MKGGYIHYIVGAYLAHKAKIIKLKTHPINLRILDAVGGIPYATIADIYRTKV
jgi:hypothetical protein